MLLQSAAAPLPKCDPLDSSHTATSDHIAWWSTPTLGQPVISHFISRASAGLFASGGLVLLFVPDVILPWLIPGYPSAGIWFAQLLAAAWLALACLNWFNRNALLGGIYSRSVVVSNAVCYFVGATALLRAATRQHLPGSCWFLVAPVALFALVYGWLLFRGPFERDVAVYSRAQQGSA